MKVWIDACTGKHVRYAWAIANRLRSLGHKLILTTRKHPDTMDLANMLGGEFTVVGEYDPASLFTKLQASVKRELSFCQMFKEDAPDLSISHQSVEACRVAFGLGMPIISTADAPHAEAANRLTLQLVSVLVISKAIPQSHYRSCGIKNIVQFDGVDEVAWIKGYKPKLNVEEYGKPLIVVRQTETKASYAYGKMDVTEEIARKLTSLGQVVFIPRYEKRSRRGLIVPQKFVDSVSLAGKADLVVSVGGTMAREAALQGTPSIVIPIIEPKFYYTNNYLSKLGFPLFTVNLSDVMKYVKKYVGVKWDVKEKFDKLENPVDVIENIVKEGKYD
jgi:predicted glycosyltransferase